MTANAGLLKLELIADGIRAAAGLPQPLANPFGLVHLVLPDKVTVSVHLISDGNQTPFTLLEEGKQFYLERKGPMAERVPVSWTPPLHSYGGGGCIGPLV